MDKAARDLDKRCLPGAVRAEQANQLALLDYEVDTPQRLDPAVALRQSPDGKGRHAASVRGPEPPLVVLTSPP